jgi:hypothetical protein
MRDLAALLAEPEPQDPFEDIPDIAPQVVQRIVKHEPQGAGSTCRLAAVAR